MWVVSKNEPNCLLENKMISSLIWRNVRLLYVVQSNILWLTNHYRCNILCTSKIPSFFLAVHRNQKNKINHYCKQFYECSCHQKNFCTLCVPTFYTCCCKNIKPFLSLLNAKTTETRKLEFSIAKKNKKEYIHHKKGKTC